MKLLSNDLTQKILALESNIQKELPHHPEFKIGKNHFHLLTPQSQYVIQTAQYLRKIIHSVEWIKKITIFLQRYPLKNFYKKNDIDELIYTQYHFEVFMHKVHTLLELMRLMLNVVYDIGLKEEDCSWGNLCSKEEIKSSKAYPIFNSFYSHFKVIIENRHLITHRAIFQDQKKDSLELHSNHYSWNTLLNLGQEDDLQNLYPKIFLDMEIKAYRKDRNEIIADAYHKATEYINNYFDSIHDDFFNKLNKLSSLPQNN